MKRIERQKGEIRGVLKNEPQTRIKMKKTLNLWVNGKGWTPFEYEKLSDLKSEGIVVFRKGAFCVEYPARHQQGLTVLPLCNLAPNCKVFKL